MSWKLRLSFALFLSAVSIPVARVQGTAPTSQPAADQLASDPSRFLRFIGDSKSGGKLETSEVTFANDAGVKVRLISAVHIGEPSYYHDLQKSFESSDAVLYEMVKPKGSAPPVRGQHSDSNVSKLQNFLKDQLGLSFQLDEVDYTPKNFIHADLDAETFYKLQSDRGESFASLILKSILNSIADPSVGRVYDDEPTDLVDFMTRPDAQGQLKLLVARRMGDIEKDAGEMDALNGTVILTERNKAVTKALQAALKSGKKNIAIFYGAAHMPELTDRLDLMGFKPIGTTWHTAWDVHINPNAPSAFMKVMSKVNESLQEPAK